VPDKKPYVKAGKIFCPEGHEVNALMQRVVWMSPITSVYWTGDDPDFLADLDPDEEPDSDDVTIEADCGYSDDPGQNDPVLFCRICDHGYDIPGWSIV